MSEQIEGRNAVLEAFRSGKCVDKLFILDGCQDGPVRTIAREARKKDTIINYVAKERLDQLSETGAHQGVIALCAVKEYSTIEDMLAVAAERGEAPFLVLCDEISDPHNLGAIIRTAESAGAHGVIIPKRRSASLNYTVYKTSAGAASWLPVARVPNIPAAIEELKQNGVWIYGTDASGQRYDTVDLSGAIGLVIGSEGYGIGRLTASKCDFMLSLPMKGKITSLNASVAAGIFMYEAVRQREASGIK